MDIRQPRLPLTVVGGYLGAGKTTLVNALLADPQGQRIAVLVNDFGEIGIDEGLITAGDGNVISLANGCVCCSLADGFAVTLDRVRAMADRLDRVVTEVSGVGEPGKVAQWAKTPGFGPDGVLVVVDGSRVRRQFADARIGQTVAGQVTDADLLLLTHCDLLDEVDLVPVEEALGELSSAPVLRAPADPALLFGVEPATAGPEPAERNTHAEHVTCSLPLSKPVSLSTLELWQQARPQGVVRAKGILRTDDEPEARTIVQVVGDSTAITTSGDWTGGEPGAGAGAVVAIAVPGTPRAALAKWLGML